MEEVRGGDSEKNDGTGTVLHWGSEKEKERERRYQRSTTGQWSLIELHAKQDYKV